MERPHRSHRQDPGTPVVADSYDAVQERRRTAIDDTGARERFAGINLGACFFGWIVAIGVALLLTGIAGAVAAGAGSSVGITQSEAERESGTIGVASAVVLVVVLLVGYYFGGYVAGRMSRFDGARQGLGVWALGLVVTLLAGLVGAVLGTQYDVLDRVALPRLPIATTDLSIGAAVTALVVVVGTLLAALLGGRVGHRYHHRVDRAVVRT